MARADDPEIAACISASGTDKLVGRGDFLLIAKGHLTRFQAAYFNEQEIRQIISRMNAGGRFSRRWLSGETQTPPLAATGTDGRAAAMPAATTTQPKSKRRGLGFMFGHQLRLIK